MECVTSFGKPKVKFETFDLAVIEAKKLNAQDKRIHKLVAYKCKVCHKFHIGSNGRLLKKSNNIYIQK